MHLYTFLYCSPTSNLSHLVCVLFMFLYQNFTVWIYPFYFNPLFFKWIYFPISQKSFLRILILIYINSSLILAIVRCFVYKWNSKLSIFDSQNIDSISILQKGKKIVVHILRLVFSFSYVNLIKFYLTKQNYLIPANSDQKYLTQLESI